MKNMLEKILEIDKKAKEDLKQIKTAKIESEKQLNETLKQKRENYLANANENIKKMEKKEKAKAFIKLKRIENKYSEALKNTLEIYEKNKENWVNELTKKVLES